MGRALRERLYPGRVGAQDAEVVGCSAVGDVRGVEFCEGGRQGGGTPWSEQKWGWGSEGGKECERVKKRVGKWPSWNLELGWDEDTTACRHS